MFWHQGRYYLYYLVTEHSPGEGVWLSSSSDGVHWQEHGLVLKAAQDAQWLGSTTLRTLTPDAKQNYCRLRKLFQPTWLVQTANCHSCQGQTQPRVNPTLAVY